MRNLTASLTCPNCGRTVTVKIKEVIPGRSKRLQCGCTITFAGDDGRKVQRELDNLERELKKLNRKLRF
jgi:hypothetical protein